MSIKFLLRRKKQFDPQSDLCRVSQFIIDDVLMERDRIVQNCISCSTHKGLSKYHQVSTLNVRITKAGLSWV